jgi:transcription elongation GreA/GreB family factor
VNGNACILTAGDFATLSRLSDEWNACGSDIAVQLRRKLERAQVVFPSDLPRDVASLGSTITYSERNSEPCTVTLTALMLIGDRYLPISHTLGLALLGLREGDQVEVEAGQEKVQRFTLDQVIDRPESAWPGRF